MLFMLSSKENERSGPVFPRVWHKPKKFRIRPGNRVALSTTIRFDFAGINYVKDFTVTVHISKTSGFTAQSAGKDRENYKPKTRLCINASGGKNQPGRGKIGPSLSERTYSCVITFRTPLL